VHTKYMYLKKLYLDNWIYCIACSLTQRPVNSREPICGPHIGYEKPGFGTHASSLWVSEPLSSRAHGLWPRDRAQVLYRAPSSDGSGPLNSRCQGPKLWGPGLPNSDSTRAAANILHIELKTCIKSTCMPTWC